LKWVSVYDIIRQFSQQLYTNPRKAIEELICNSYDAGAKECWVKLPKASNEPLYVLDNGTSMDLDGLRDLWKVAVSPKVHNGQARIEHGRKQIGKFGVGKLAAFALGGRLAHVACVKDTVRIISVGQSEIREQQGGKPPTFNVYKTTLARVKELLGPANLYLCSFWGLTGGHEPLFQECRLEGPVFG
jgi:Histidine kinase-, DNA gyrase B-, and HSP90-like ATPase